MLTKDTVTEVFPETTPVGISPFSRRTACSGTSENAHMEWDAKDGILAYPASNLEKWASPTRHPNTTGNPQEVGQETRTANNDRIADPSYHGGGVKWATADIIAAHTEVMSSGKCNFEG